MQRPKLPEPELAITHWMSDGKMVKVVCLDCHRSDFHTLVGFINHCRRAHSREFPSREAAIEASGEEVYMDTSRDPRSNGSGRPWRSDMELTYRMSDGKMIKLVCLDCRRSNFYNAEGFINHCDIAHSRQFLSLKAAIEAYGEEVDMDMEGDPGESSVTSVAASQPSWGSPGTLDRAERSAIPIDHKQWEDAKHPTHSSTPTPEDAGPPVTPEKKKRDQRSEGTGESKRHSYMVTVRSVTPEKKKRDQGSEGTGESKRRSYMVTVLSARPRKRRYRRKQTPSRRELWFERER